MVHLTTYLDLESLKIQKSGFDFKSNLTSAIGNLAKLQHLASYVSCHNDMAYNINSYLIDRISEEHIFERMFVTSHVSFFKDIWLHAKLGAILWRHFQCNFDKSTFSSAK